MRTRAILAAVLAVLPAAAAAQGLTGSVVDANTQRAIPADVGVLIETPTGMVSDGIEAGSGAFTMTALPIGTAIVYAVSRGYSPGWTEVRLSASQSQTTRFSLKLEAGVSGTVLDSGGRPVSGAFIETEYPDDVGAYGLLDSYSYGQRVTDVKGEFRLLGLIADTTATLYADVNGVRSADVTVNTSAGMTQGGVVIQAP